MPCKSLLTCSLALWLTTAGAVAAGEVVRIEEYEAAGISGFRALWDIPVVLRDDGRAVERDGHLTALWLPEDRTGKKRQVGYGELMAASLQGPEERLAGVREAGALGFDALHRKMLVRFPRAAEVIASKIAAGHTVAKIELVLPFRDTELHPFGDVNSPLGYTYRMNWGVKDWWSRVPPNWHAVAWALRRPWVADHRIGPTYNAYTRNGGYWTRFEARDEAKDRFALRFGPAEVSHEVADGRLDVTEVFRDERFGRMPGERLRLLSDCGFLVAKWELYDHRYYGGPYEWATGTGGRAILINAPRLEVTFAKAPPAPAKLPPAADVRALAERLTREGPDGRPTAVIPDAEALQKLVHRHQPAKPDWMAPWQWERLQEILKAGSPGIPAGAPFWWHYAWSPRTVQEQFAKDPRLLDRAMYAAWLDVLIGRQPRGWEGFSAGEWLLPLFAFSDAIPAPVLEYKKLFWECWLMPDRPTAPIDRIWDDAYHEGPLVHPQIGSLKPSREVKMIPGKGHGEMTPPPGAKPSDAFDSYYAATGDWRGNKSFYRSGYLYSMSTMNFNTMAAMAALLAGTYIKSDLAIRDGRHGMEHWPLRTWSWLDGTLQESIDHYYLGHSLSAQKMVRDFAYGEFDRLIGAAMVAKTMEELLTAYHPGLRRLIANSTRTNIEQVLGMQEGIYSVLHLLSPSGTLRELNKEKLAAGMQVVGANFPPAKVARQSMTGPWAPEWTSNVVDKPLPFRTTAAYTQWGGRRDPPVFRRAYLGRHYGMASVDLLTLNIETMVQWRRADRQVQSACDLGTMLFYSDVNDTQFGNLWLRPTANPTLQHDNKMIVLNCHQGTHHAYGAKEGVKSIQQSLVLFNFEEPQPSWSIFVDGRKVESLPADVRFGQRITIQDGVSYVGIIPLPAADLGRSAEVRIEQGRREGNLYSALMIQSYNRLRDTPAPVEIEAVKKAYGGFVVEMGDATEYPDFPAFQAHLRKAALDTRWDPAEATAHVKYTSGPDVLEMGFRTTYRSGKQSSEGFAYRRINGRWPYLPEGLYRDTTLSQQGTTGRLEKNGAVLLSSKGRSSEASVPPSSGDPTRAPAVPGSGMTYLLTEPRSGSYLAWNALPDPIYFMLSAPGNVEILADGKVGLLSVDLQTGPGVLKIGCAVREDQTADSMARVLLVFGMKKAPPVELNGRPLGRKLSNVSVDGRDAWVVPLFHEAKLTDTSAKLIERCRLATGEFGRSAKQGR